MKRKTADRALATVLVLFAVIAVVRWFYRDAIWSLALLRMAEAALVGGVADWFAVTALFTKPLGIAFHTAIIPRNREKIVNAMAYMVQEEFLSRQSILRHLQKIRMVVLVIRWMESGGKETMLRLWTKLVEVWLREADRLQITSVLATAIRSRLQTVQLHTYASNVGHWLIQTGKADQLFDMALAQVKQAAARPALRQDIYRLLDNAARQATGENTLGRLFGAFLRTFDFINLDEAADVLHQRLQSELRELEQPHHPLRIWLSDRMIQSLRELENNAEWQISVDEWKNGLLERIPLEVFLQPLVDRLLQPVSCGQNGICDSHPLIAGMSRFAATYWDAFRQDISLQAWLEKYLQEAAAEVALSEHKLIGELVGQALGTLSDQELNSFIEDKVGEDLAWIRINGSVVGALAGLAVFFLGHYIYLPYIWPWLDAVLITQ